MAPAIPSQPFRSIGVDRRDSRTSAGEKRMASTCHNAWEYNIGPLRGATRPHVPPFRLPMVSVACYDAKVSSASRPHRWLHLAGFGNHLPAVQSTPLSGCAPVPCMTSGPRIVAPVHLRSRQMPLATTSGRIYLGPHAQETSENALGGGRLTQQVSVGRPSHVVHPMPQRPRDL